MHNLGPDFEPIYVLRDNPNDEFVILLDWRAKNGAQVKKGQPIATLETSKAAVEIVAPQDGYIKFRLQPGERVTVGELLAFICSKPNFEPPFEDHQNKTASVGAIKITQKAQQLIEQYGLSEKDFVGLSIVKEQDVRDKVSGRAQAETNYQVKVKRVPLQSSKVFEISRLRSVADGVIYSKVESPVNRKEIEKNIKKLCGDSHIVTIGEYVLSCTARVLSEFPEFNAHFSDDSITQYQDINIGYAININKGLKAPVIQIADQLSLVKISEQMKDLAMKYLRDELTPAELTNGTFTITDLFSAGVTSFDPMINFQQSAILGICSNPPESDYFNLILAFDHRVTDGMRAAAFLSALKKELLSRAKA
jgi:pyruvate/2-oxoglutarate dehydrogenase complex dihydrolipoamide acyltransferase (E2) component